MSTDTIDLLIELAENEGSSHYGDACREAVAALTAAAEREAAKDTEIERLTAENAVLVKAIEFDPEPDLPEDECTTAAMLYKIAIQWDTLLEIAQQNPDAPQFVAARVKELVAEYQWPKGLRSRGDFLEKRARREYVAESALTESRAAVARLTEAVAESGRAERFAENAASDYSRELTAQRQKVQALREWVRDRYGAHNANRQEDRAGAYADVLARIDALGLLPAAPVGETP